MRRLGKILVILVGCVLVLMLAAMGVVIMVSKSRAEHIYTVRVRSVAVPKAPDATKEGDRLFFARGCSDCHGEDGTGKIIVDGAIGRFVGPNLTQLMPTLTDDDIVRAIRHGVGKGGRALAFMPSDEYHGMSDRDVGYIIAFLRTMKPTPGVTERCEPRPLGRALHVAGLWDLYTAEKINHDEEPPVTPEPADTVEFGEYLAIGCMGCHGQHYSGGPIPGAPPEMGNPANLTPHESGLGTWTQEDFVHAIREGKRPDGKTLNPKQMPWTSLSHMSDLELSALWKFLQSLPPLPAGGR